MKVARFACLALVMMEASCSTDNGGTPAASNAGSGPIGGSSGTGGMAASGTGGSAGSAGGSGGTSAVAGSGGTSSGAAGSGGTAGASPCTSAGGADAVTSLCGDKPLNTLTEAEATELCTDTGAYVARSLTRANACKYYALVSSASSSAPTETELQAFCTMSESACNMPGSTMGTGMNTLCSEIPDGCTATVAQYSTCVKDETMAFDQGINGLPACSTLTFATVGASFDLPTTATQAASCMALVTACPGYSAPYIN